MEKDWENLEEVLPESSSQLVSLNTRVPRFVSKMIDESVGILQTKSPYLKVSKQAAIQILIERGYEIIRAEFERMDYAESEIAITKEFSSENIVSIEREEKPRRTFDMKAYSEMANKTYYNAPKPHTPSKENESAKRIQASLGLR